MAYDDKSGTRQEDSQSETGRKGADPKPPRQEGDSPKKPVRYTDWASI